MISGWAPADLPVGLVSVVGATWVSLRFLPPLGSRVRVGSLAALAASFFRQSVVSGTDVAWRAFNPTLRLHPGLVACPLRLPSGGARSAFCALSSLLPGTLPTGTDEHGALLVHCLDVGQPVAANLAAEERCSSGRSAMTEFLLATAGFDPVDRGGRPRAHPGRTGQRRSHDGGAAARHRGHRRSLLLVAAATGVRGVEDVALGLALLAAFASVAFVNSAAPPEGS